MPHERTSLAGRLLTIPIALVPWVVVSRTSAAKAQVAILTPVGFPPNVTLCQPVNFTWTGGAPPYWLYIYGDVTSGKLIGQNTTGIPTTWFVWIPDIPAVPESSIRIQIGGPNAVMRGGVSLSRLIGEDASCLNTSAAAATATSFQSDSGTATSFLTTGRPTPSFQSGEVPGATSQSAPIPALSTDRLSKAAVAGIAVAATFVGIWLVLAVCVVALARRRKRARQLQQGNADTSPSPYPYPVAISTTEIPASASGMPTPPVHVDPQINGFPPSVARDDAESEHGYSVVADVGGGLESGSPDSPSLELATDRPQSRTGNCHARPPEGLVHQTAHQDPGRKRGRALLQPRPHEDAGFRQELDGVTPPEVGEREGGRTSSRRLEPESDAPGSIGRAVADGWEVRSPSELPPYVP